MILGHPGSCVTAGLGASGTSSQISSASSKDLARHILQRG